VRFRHDKCFRITEQPTDFLTLEPVSLNTTFQIRHHRSSFLSCVVAGLGLATVAHAQIPDATVSASAESGVPFGNLTQTSSTEEATFGTITANFASSSVVPAVPPTQMFSGFGTATVNGGISPSLSATGTIEVYSDVYPAVADSSGATANLNYSFEISGPASANVPVNLSSLLSFDLDTNGIPAGEDGSSYYGRVFLDISNIGSWSGTLNDDGSPVGPIGWGDPENDNSFSGNINQTFDFATDTVYTVNLVVTADINAPPQYDYDISPFSYTPPGTYSITASIDPTLTVGEGYSIDYSPNLGVSSGVPDTASTLGLLSLSLIGLALVYRRSLLVRW
jgi:hypothetical protein